MEDRQVTEVGSGRRPGELRRRLDGRRNSTPSSTWLSPSPALLPAPATPEGVCPGRARPQTPHTPLPSLWWLPITPATRLKPRGAPRSRDFRWHIEFSAAANAEPPPRHPPGLDMNTEHRHHEGHRGPASAQQTAASGAADRRDETAVRPPRARTRSPGLAGAWVSGPCRLVPSCLLTGETPPEPDLALRCAAAAFVPQPSATVSSSEATLVSPRVTL